MAPTNLDPFFKFITLVSLLDSFKNLLTLEAYDATIDPQESITMFASMIL